MTSCPSCSASLNAAEAQAGSCPICGTALVTSEDQDIARSIRLPKNWAADADTLSGLFDSFDDDAATAEPKQQASGESQNNGSARTASGNSTATVDEGPSSSTGGTTAAPADLAPAEDPMVDRLLEQIDAELSTDEVPGSSAESAESGTAASEEESGDTDAAEESPSVLASMLESPEVADTLNQAMAGITEGTAPSTSLKLGPARDGGGVGGGILGNLLSDSGNQPAPIQDAAPPEADGGAALDQTVPVDSAVLAEVAGAGENGDEKPDDAASDRTLLISDVPEEAEPDATPPADTGLNQTAVLDSPADGGAPTPQSGDPEKTILASDADPQFRSGDDTSEMDSVFSATLVVKPRKFSSNGINADSEGADYSLLKLLGEGGMGTVHLAQQNSIDRAVAIKTLKASFESDQDAKQKFLAEAVVTGDLDHPNIVPIYDLGTDDKNVLFYSMKRVSGTPWMDALPQKSLHENLDILMKVADAVAFAHSRGVIHRDLKPENVMLGEFGEVLVMDWGLALTLDTFNQAHGVNQSGGMGGTPAYMAPEMLIGQLEEIGEAADVYLLGAILFEIIVGRPPHHGKDARDCLLAVARNVIIPTEVTGELMTIARKAMSDLPQDRYPTVRALQDDIRQYLSHSESVALSERAAADLQAAQESGDYQDYARALFGFQEAVELWEGNKPAKAGEIQAAFIYASAAHEKGDFDLAASLLKPDLPDHRELRATITAAQKERDARRQRLKTVRRLAIGLVAVVLSVVLGAFFWIRAEADRAKRAEVAARQQRDEADTQKKLALSAKSEADRKRQEAVESKKKAVAATDRAVSEQKKAEIARQKAELEQKRAEAAKQAEEYEAYIAQIGLAAAKIDENAFETAVGILKSCQPKLRNWEWGRLMYLCTQSSRTYAANAPVDVLDLSADQRRMVCGSWDGTARVWDVASGRLELTLQHGGAYVHAVAFAPDGTTIATGSNDAAGFVQLWDAETGERKAILRGHTDAVLSTQFSKDGARLLTTSYDRTARLWDVATGKEIRTFSGHMWWVWDADFSPDEQQIVTASQDGTALIWDAETGKKEAPFTGHEGPVFTCAFAPDGKQIVTGGYDNRVLLWRPDEVKPYDYAALLAGDDVEPPKYRALDGHTAGVRSVAYSEDGTLIASGGHDNTVRLWERETGRLIKTFRGHDSWVRDCRFSADGRRIYSASHDRTVKAWSIADYEELKVLNGRTLAGHDDAVLDARFAPDGRSVVTASRDRTARTWRTADGSSLQVFREGHAFLASSAIFFPDGRRLITSAVDNTTRIWDFNTATQQLRLDETGRSAALALSPDGQWILTGGDNKTARLWNSRTGELVATLEGHRFDVTAVAFSGDGSLIYTGDARGHGRMWERKSGELRFKLEGHTRRIVAAAFHPSRPELLTASGDNTVGRWDVQSGKELSGQALSHPDSVTAFTLLNDGRHAVTGCADGLVRVWETADSRAIRTLGEAGAAVNSVAVNRDGSRVAAAWSESNTVRMWDLGTGEELLAGKTGGPPRPLIDLHGTSQRVWSVRFSPNGNRLLTVGGNGARLWDARTGRGQLSFSPQGAVASADFSPEGERLVTGSWDNSARIWDVAAGRAVLKLEGEHRGGVNSTAFSPDGRTVMTASDDRTIKLWDAHSGKLLMTCSGHTERVRSAVFSPDGQLLVSASDDRTAMIWDRATGEMLRTLAAHQRGVTCARFSADGTQVITGSDDNSARIWDVQTGRETLPAPLEGHTAGLSSVAFSPDGRRVLTAGKDNTAKLWDARTGKQILSLTGHSREITAISFSPDGRSVLTGSRDGTAILWQSRPWSQPADGASLPIAGPVDAATGPAEVRDTQPSSASAGEVTTGNSQHGTATSNKPLAADGEVRSGKETRP